jgi:hypothetical protein
VTSPLGLTACEVCGHLAFTGIDSGFGHLDLCFTCRMMIFDQRWKALAGRAVQRTAAELEAAQRRAHGALLP